MPSKGGVCALCNVTKGIECVHHSEAKGGVPMGLVSLLNLELDILSWIILFFF